ncbi:WSC domain-containing protein [Phlyctema vagabunda]|uniref:WSC domain-containing protein n=1 Tax=Phlyctema vagabunda TaxID=108571 RepID=A0ABR4P8S3_9HELO
MRTSQTILVAVALWSAVIEGYWRMSCSVIQTGRVDPVVNYNAPSSHVHKISGAANININSTYASLQEAECTSCSIQADKSAYWTPQLYYRQASGQYVEVPNSGMAVYYLGRGKGADGSAAVPFPEGLQMLSGNTNARSYNSNVTTWGNKTYPSRPLAQRVSFVCINYDKAIPESYGMVNTTCPQGLRAQIQMQSCWDGKNLASSDQSHVAYLSHIDNGACPPTHPILLPHLFYEVLYSVNKFSPATDGGKYVFANGDETGYGFHGDFLNGWDTPTLQAGIDQCLRGTGTGAGTPGDGGVQDCPPFQTTNTNDFADLCPERSPIYPCETVHGSIGTSLPGCITPTGAGRDSTFSLTTCPGGNSVACSPESSPHGPLVSDGNDDYKLIGCFGEVKGGRALKKKSYSNSTNTVAQCLEFCSGSKFAGVEWSKECYCGDTLDSTSLQINATECDMTCSGNQYEICGGGSALNVYTLKNTPSSATSSSSQISTATSSTVSESATLSLSSSSSQSSLTSSPMSSTTASSLISSSSIQFPSTSSFTISKSSTLSLSSSSSQSSLISNPRSSTTTSSISSFPTQFSSALSSTISRSTIISLSSSSSQSSLTSKSASSASESSITSSTASFATSMKSVSPPIITGPSVLTGDANFGYFACVKEPANGHALATQLSITKPVTAEKCLAAAANDYSWAGLEYGGECWAGTSLNQKTAANTTEASCKMTCSGNSNQICGGSRLLSMYKRTSVLIQKTNPFNGTSLGYQYVGCVNEVPNGHILKKRLDASDTMTAESCLNLVNQAVAKGSTYQYAGIGYGRECYAGVNTTDIVVSDGCNMQCPGNSSQWCGGSMRLSFYSRT